MKVLHVVGARPNFMKVAPITSLRQAQYKRQPFTSTSSVQATELRTRLSTSMREMEDGGGRMEGGRGEWKAVERESENMERGGA